jgi:tripartite-type tricarboxylate transporter receptor subunit TctC
MKLLTVLALLLAHGTTLAQNYPTKSVRMIVHFPPGGPTDMVARVVAQKLTEAWGQQFVVDNRPSAGGIIGVELVARAAPDGYTLLFGTGGSMSIMPATGKKLPYDVNADFAPVALVVINPQILVFNAQFPPGTVKELIAYARANPGKVNYASVGPGSPNHLGSEMLKSMTGIDLTHIPYKGTAPAVTDLLAGQVALLFNSMPTVIPHVKSGRLKGVAVAGAKRSLAMPDLPTVLETIPGFEYTTWYGMFAPVATPRATVSKLNAEVQKMLADKVLAQSLIVQGAEPSPGTPEELGRYMREEQQRWRALIKRTNLKLD